MSKITVTLATPGTSADAFFDEMSGDGRFLLTFSSAGSNLGTLTYRDVQAGTSQTLATDVHSSTLSDDGRFVAYVTEDNDTVRLNLWDSTNGTVRVVASIPDHQGFLVQTGFFNPKITADNKYVYYTSIDQTLVPGDTDDGDDQVDLYRVDLQTGAVQQIYETVNAGTLSLSADGRYLVTSTYRGDETLSNLSADFFRLDTSTGQTVPFGPGNGESSFDQHMSHGATLSSDGRFVVFTSLDDLIPSDTNHVADVYLFDFSTGALSVVSSTAGGTVDAGASFDGVMSADGTRVAFTTQAPNLSTGAGPNSYHVVVKDLASGIVSFAVNTSDSGVQSYDISSDGLTIGFQTKEPLTSNDTDSLTDAYVVRYFRPTIAITTVSGDNLVNATEVNSPVAVAGTSDAIGRTVQITSPNGATATATVQTDGSWSATLAVSGTAEGARSVTATVLDDAGVRGTATKSVVFDYTPPFLTLDAVAGDNLINAAEKAAAIISGTSNAIGQPVNLVIDGQIVGAPTIQPSGVWSFTYDASALPDGQHTIGFSVSDPAGNSIEHEVFFDKDTTPPQIDILAIGGDNVIDPTEVDALVAVVGTVDEAGAIGQTVGISINGELRATAVVQADRTWQADVDFQGMAGQVLVTAEVADNAGNQGSDTETALVDSNIIRVSVRADGSQGFGPGFDWEMGFHGGSVSPDGRFVVFDAGSGPDYEPLVPETGPGLNVLLKDLKTGALTALTNSGAGHPGFNSQLSDDGRFVVYASPDGDFVLELATGTLSQVNANAAAAPDNRGSIDTSRPEISPDGRYVVFTSAGTNLVPGVDTQNASNPTDRVYVKDLQTGEVKLVSMPEAESTLGHSSHSGLGGGRYVAFQSTKAAVANDTNNTDDIFVRDLQTGTITLVSATPSGAGGSGPSLQPEISPDGRYVAFLSYATNLVPGFSPQPYQQFAYLRDLQTGTTQLLSVTLDGAPVEGFGSAPSFSFSADNRYVTFVNSPLTLGQGDVYVRDLQTNTVKLVSTGNFVDTIDAGSGGDLTPDGRYIAFNSVADDTVAGDSNSSFDVFLRRLLPQSLTIDPIAGDDRVDATEAAAALAIGGTSSIIGGEVTVRLDGQQVATATIAPDGTWSSVIDVLQLSRGTHAVTASTLDGPGFTSSDGALLDIAFDPAPAITLYAPGPIVGGTGVPGSVVQVYDNGVAVGSTSVNPSGEWGMFIPAPGDGVHSLTARLFHGADPSSPFSAAIAVSVAGESLTLAGTAAAEALTGGNAVDYLAGGGGDDTLTGGGGGDALHGQAGNDTINGGDGDDVLIGLTGNDLLNGEDGNDTLIGDDGGDPTPGADQLFGGTGNDQMFGYAGADTEDGGAGADFLSGGTGNDTLSGGTDGDAIFGDDGNDTANGGDGDDVLIGGIGDDTLNGDAGNDTLIGGVGVDTMNGGDGNDQMFGYEDADIGNGGIGDDFIAGGSGNDTLHGDDGGDVVDGEADDDQLFGDDGGDNLNGNLGNDQLFGGAGNDGLLGLDGNDILDGGTGNDFLIGDIAGGDGTLGNDTFVFHDGTGNDNVADFNGGAGLGDVIDIRDFHFADFNAVMAAATDLPNGIYIQLDADDAILIEGHVKAQLAADDFLLA